MSDTVESCLPLDKVCIIDCSPPQVLQALCLDNDKGQARLVDDEMRRRRVKPDK